MKIKKFGMYERYLKITFLINIHVFFPEPEMDEMEMDVRHIFKGTSTDI